MGLFDKIKDNAKTISMKALEATREYDDEYQPAQPAGSTVEPNTPEAPVQATEPSPTPETVEPEFEFEAEPVPEEAPAETPAEQTEEKKEEKEAKEEKPRKSKVTEISKEEHEKTEKEKRQEKAKQAAKERLAKSYVPSYKKSQEADKVEVKKEEKDTKDKESQEEKPTTKKTTAAPKPTVGIIDVKPGKITDPVKRAIYARERAALNALASQRKLNGTVPLYTASHMNFRTKVYINRVEYSGSFGKNVLPIDQVAWVKIRNGGTGIIIETTEGKRVVMVVKQADRLAFVDAVMKVQAMQPKKGKFKDTQTIRIDKLEQFGEGIDEIEKLAKLYDKGILSQEEFDAKKKQILGL